MSAPTLDMVTAMVTAAQGVVLMQRHQRIQKVQDDLAAALYDAWDYCRLYGIGNAPEVIAAAARSAQREVVKDGGEGLTEQRPGCWEAAHVDALAAGWDLDEGVQC